MKRIVYIAAVLSFAVAGAAQAQSIGTATTALNIRSGPGPEQPVIGYMKSRQKAQIIGCVEGSLWCQINFRGQQGWAYSQYMSLASPSGTIIVREPANVVDVPVVSYNAPGYITPTYRADVAPLAEAITAPVVGAGGTGAGAIGAPRPTIYASTFTPPPPPVSNYVAANVANSYVYPGEVVVGASLPRTVVLNNVPDYRYQYVYVNDTPVLVDPVTRQIVYVFR